MKVPGWVVKWLEAAGIAADDFLRIFEEAAKKIDAPQELIDTVSLWVQENVKAQFMKVYQLALGSSDLAAASRALEGLTRLLGMEKPSEVVHQHLHATISPKQLEALDQEIARLQQIIAIEDHTIEADYQEVTSE